MWSAKALEAAAANPERKSGQYLRVEHGTPRRQFARLVLRAFQANQLTQSWLDDLCDAKWRVAVITLDEDRVLARSEYHEDPEARWRAAGIELRSTLRERGIDQRSATALELDPSNLSKRLRGKARQGAE
jgi:hypothetical protein